MKDAETYIVETAPAVEGFFALLNQYGWKKIHAVVAMTNATTLGELNEHKESFSSTDIAREVVAGSILQIAYSAIANYAKPAAKSDNASHFESEINRLICENPGKTRVRRRFKLPTQFCVGRDIGHLPMGIVIYAGRNQYNHFYETKRLSVMNELVFNHLRQIWPKPNNGLSFDVKPGKLFSYSILAALGWLDTSREFGYEAYKRDICDILKAKLY